MRKKRKDSERSRAEVEALAVLLHQQEHLSAPATPLQKRLMRHMCERVSDYWEQYTDPEKSVQQCFDYVERRIDQTVGELLSRSEDVYARISPETLFSWCDEYWKR